MEGRTGYDTWSGLFTPHTMVMVMMMTCWYRHRPWKSTVQHCVSQLNLLRFVEIHLYLVSVVPFWAHRLKELDLLRLMEFESLPLVLLVTFRFHGFYEMHLRRMEFNLSLGIFLAVHKAVHEERLTWLVIVNRFRWLVFWLFRFSWFWKPRDTSKPIAKLRMTVQGFFEWTFREFDYLYDTNTDLSIVD